MSCAFILLVGLVCVDASSNVLPPWPLRGFASVSSSAGARAGAPVRNVALMGAKADNRTDNSPIFAAALHELERLGGGTLLVPQSGIYLTLPLNLTTSGTRLEIQTGATLKALCDNSRWPRIPVLPSYSSKHGEWFAPFIGAADVHDIVLSGGGTVDGSGHCFWDSQGSMKGSRGNLVLFERVERAELTGLTFTNSPFWTLHMWDSEDVHVHGITVHNPASSDNAQNFFAPNTDGIDIDSSRHVLLEDSYFHAGDDCVVLKSGKDAAGRAFKTPTANVLMRNLTLEACSCFKHSHGGLHGGLHWYDGCGGLKVGTEMSGGIENITFEDSHIDYSGAALKMLSPAGRGGYIRNATWRNITADESGGLLWMQISNASKVPAENAYVSHITVEDITLRKLRCRYYSSAHPQSDCESVGVLDLNQNEPRVDLKMRNVKVLEGGERGWSCTGPPAKLVAPPAGVAPPLPPSCASQMVATTRTSRQP